MKVDILVATYRHFNSSAYAATMRMVHYTKAQGVDLAVPALHGSSLVHRARNAAMNAIRDDADYVLLLDDDMSPEHDSLLRLLKHEVPAVSALTVTRELPTKLTASVYRADKDWMCPMTNFRDETLLSGQLGVGGGFLVLSRGTIQSALNFHLDARDWLEDNRKSLDRMRVRNENREKERQEIASRRRKLFDEKRYHRVFHFAVHDEQSELGEDHSFCRNLIRLGIPVAIDTGVQVGHVGDFPYGPWNLDDKDPRTLALFQEKVA